ncbi:MAG: recombinase family protein [Alphaproteobacteria bacterium]|nr:recombinase family protein [Alphaproteobacteria bacterium]
MVKINCAVYVRKSTEKGLELEFNSLHNQEEACRNYILSQAFNNWEYYKTYTDGGISGGTTDRPALQEMIRDIKAGKIQTVVVYKVDRLSRSIMDFHNMMTEFDKHSCNFVSITQAFDTSTSMGKLTLNMLLSFAQFEREVSSERVRDKLHAQKSKGLWTGGIPKLGYDIKDKKLVINKAEAEEVKEIFEKYIELPSVLELMFYLRDKGITHKKWKTADDKERGGAPIGSSALSRLLREKVYAGYIENKRTKEAFKGQHKPIISKELFDSVQEKLANNYKRGDVPYRQKTYLLHNKITDAAGNVFTNQKSSKNQKQKYRYYKLKGFYLPAGDLEKITCETVKAFLDSNMKALPGSTKLAFKQIHYSEELIPTMIDKIIYHENRLTYFINIADLSYLTPFKQSNLNTSENELSGSYLSNDGRFMIIEKPIFIRKGIATNRYNGSETSILTKTENAQALIKALAQGWRYKKLYESGTPVEHIMKQEKIAHRTVYKYLNLAYLSPRIINHIMDGKEDICIGLQNLFSIASSCTTFAEQENAFFSKR